MDLKEEIKNSIKLSEVIAQKLTLKRRDSNNYLALCPFHKEKTPSFNISDDKGFYHCFGCGKNGDIFSFLMETENLSFLEALKKLAEQAGINISKQNFFEDSKTTNHLNLLKRASESYINNLNAAIGEKAKSYLQKRGLDKYITDSFSIGYSGNLKSNQYLVSCLLKEGFSLNDLIDVGLVKQNKNKNPTFYFQQRIMIPITNSSGKIIAFGGRILNDGNPKYLNSPETSLFRKSKQLFGVFNAKKLLQKKRFIICEGYMDVLCLHSIGYPAVASLGTGMTDDQIEIIF
jgi:DNA primase, catalytic core